MTHDASLVRDCQRCAALCCVAPAFDRSVEFAFDKPAATPCRNLTAANTCKIHGSLAESGFAGCVAYDCHGAGQAATALFGGRTWRTDPALLPAMMDAFRALREIYDLRWLLQATRALLLSSAEETRRAELERDLAPAGGWTAETLAEFEQGDLAAAVRAFLRTLRPAAARLRAAAGQMDSATPVPGDAAAAAR